MNKLIKVYPLAKKIKVGSVRTLYKCMLWCQTQSCVNKLDWRCFTQLKSDCQMNIINMSLYLLIYGIVNSLVLSCYTL